MINELLFHNRSKPNNCPTGFKSYDGAYSKSIIIKGINIMEKNSVLI